MHNRLIENATIGGWHDVFSSIIEDADSNILLLDPEYRILTINGGFYWIFLETYGIELRKGKSLLEAMNKINPELTSEWRKRCQVALTGNPIKVEEAFEIDGSTYYWEIHFKATIAPDNSSVISVFSRDITVRKAYQKKILENEANVRSILNTIEDSIWLVNESFQLIDFNKEFYKKFNQAFGIKLLRGENILALFPDNLTDQKEIWRQRYESGLRGRPGKFIDAFPISGDNKIYEIKTFPILENSTVRGLTVYARDITSEVRAEELLKKQNEELTKINEELDRFVYSASHDLRAPLMSVKGLLNMVKLDPDGENKEHYLSLIEQSINKLDNFILDIINYSRNSRMELISKKIDFHALVNESMETLRYMDGAAHVQTDITIHEHVDFYSDHGRLLIIFNNIISNAVRYRDSRKESSIIAVTITPTPNKVEIIFEDNGIGIADQYVDNVFKMFFRANADSKGSGLGLYIVKGVIEKMNGRIEVSSTLGVGTKFTVEIPNLIP